MDEQFLSLHFINSENFIKCFCLENPANRQNLNIFVPLIDKQKALNNKGICKSVFIFQKKYIGVMKDHIHTGVFTFKYF